MNNKMATQTTIFSLKLEHCIICLTPQNPEWAEEFLRQNEIENFQPLINYLTGSSQDGSLEIISGGTSRSQTQNLLLPLLKNCPPLCQQCYCLFRGLNRLTVQLLEFQSEIQKHTVILRHIVKGTVEVDSEGQGQNELCSRDRFLNCFEQSPVPKELTSLISNFVIGLHQQIIENESTLVQFPSFHSSLPFLATIQDEIVYQDIETNVDVEDTLSQVQVHNISSIQEAGLSDPSRTIEVEVETSEDINQPTFSVTIIQPPAIPEETLAEVGVTNVESEAIHDPSCSNDNDTTTSTKEPTTLEVVNPSTGNKKVKARRKRGTDPGSRKNCEPLYQFCDLCNQKLKLGDEVVSHLHHHVGPSYTYYCSGCKHGYITPFRLYQYHRRRKRTHRCPADTTSCSTMDGKEIKPHLYCDICNTGKFFRYKEYQVHMEFHETPEKNFECPLCPAKFTLRKNVEIHIEETHFYQEVGGGMIQRCDICKQPIKVIDMFLHLKKEHAATEVFACRLCPKMFPSLKSIIRHQENVRLLKKSGQGHPMCCHVCAEKFFFLESYHKHLHEKHGLGEKYSCEPCNMEFLSLKAWKYHQKSRHQVEENGDDNLEDALETDTETNGPPVKKKLSVGLRRYNCPECSKSFCAKDLVLRHRVAEHGHPPPVCQICNQVFNCRSKLLKHTRISHMGINDTKSDPNAKEETHICETCGKGFTHPFRLRYHIAEKHSTETPYVCEICGKGFKGGGRGKSRLKDHIKKAHQNIKKEKKLYGTCETCGKDFYDKRIFEEHRYTHTGQRPYACTYCKQRFRQKACLKIHLKSHAQLGESFKPKGAMERAKKVKGKGKTKKN